MQLRAGDQINHYRLLAPLGKGGQGSVWKVLDPRDGGVERALKIVSLAEKGPSALDRARREAQILAGARHPALVTFHGLFEERDGVVGLLMDLVPGRSLAAATQRGPLDHARSTAVLVQLAEALAYVHGAGLVHRDLKLENVILTDAFWEDPTRRGTVKLVDFGIAASTDNDTPLTTPGAWIGTLAYLAPEVVDPASWGRVQGAPRDVFAFGVLACHLLLGEHPTGIGFHADAIDYARAYKEAQAGRIPWPPARIDGAWDAVVGACLALRPSDRPADGAALLRMLRPGAPVSKEAWSQAGAPTASYTNASRHTSTEEMPLPPGPRTLPGAPSPATVYIPPPPSRGSSPSRAGGTGVALVVVAALAAALGALSFAYFSKPDEKKASPALPPPALATVAQAAPTPVAELRHEPCRNPDLPFDARDTRFSCPPCSGKAPRLSSRSWLMRIHGVTVTPLPRPDLPKRICAQIKKEAPPICVPFTNLPDRTGAGGRLPVMSSDLDEGRVYFSVRDAEGIAAKGFGHRRPGSVRFLESALCNGFVLVIDDDPAVTITVFLDEP